jgi:hypothetical protein
MVVMHVMCTNEIEVDIVTVDTKNSATETRTRNRLNKVIEEYNKRAEGLVEKLNNSAREQQLNPEKLKLNRISDFYAFSLLYQRFLLNIVRDRGLFITRVMTSVLMGVLLGLLGYGLDDHQDGAFARYGLLYIMLVMTPFMNILAAIVNCKLYNSGRNMRF